MTVAILGIVSALVGFGLWWLRRRLTTGTTPDQARRKRYERIDRELVRDDEAGANRSLDDDLNRLRALQSDKSGSRGPSDPGLN